MPPKLKKYLIVMKKKIIQLQNGQRPVERGGAGNRVRETLQPTPH